MTAWKKENISIKNLLIFIKVEGIIIILLPVLCRDESFVFAYRSSI